MSAWKGRMQDQPRTLSPRRSRRTRSRPQSPRIRSGDESKGIQHLRGRAPGHREEACDQKLLGKNRQDQTDSARLVLRKQFPKSLRAEGTQAPRGQSEDLPERSEESHRPSQESRSGSSSERRVCSPNKQHNKKIRGRER